MGQVIYSNQTWFCNACGREHFSPLPRAYGGRAFKVCDKLCHDEIEWRDVLSIQGKEYYPKPVEVTND